MSGGRLVVLDRLGRDVKAYPLAAGLATIGSDIACDIRMLLPNVSPHHATVVVHSNQTVVSSTTTGETLVNGVGVNVCVLRHGDRIEVGGRTLRWECDQSADVASQDSSQSGSGSTRRGGRGRRSSPLQAASPRASMPASTSGKQVAIVQPQRRHASDQNESSQTSGNRARSSRNKESDGVDADTAHARKCTTRSSPKSVSMTEATKASLWIESRKRPRSAPRKPTALRMAVLRRAQSAPKMRVTKIQAPSKIDHTKQAAIMLMTGHAPKPRARPSFVVTRPSPVRGKARGGNVSATSVGVTPKRSSARAAARSSGGGAGDKSVSNLLSPMLPEPKKSALKKSFKKSTRKTETIKFDLSNLEYPDDRPSDVILLEDPKKLREDDVASEEDISLHYSDSSRSPSPRRSIHSRSSRILERSLGETYVHHLSSDRSLNPDSARSKKSPNQTVLESPSKRKSSRGSFLVNKALEFSTDDSPDTSRTNSFTDQSYSTTIASTRKTRSPKSNKQNLESYSIVDLVSMDSIGSDRSVYGSAGSECSTPPVTTPRPGRSTRGSNSLLLSSSTPYADKIQHPGSKTASPVSLQSRNSSPQVSVKSRKSTPSKRSSSITTPENTQTRITLNSTKISRASRSRSRINDSDILLMDDDDASPRSSRRISKSSLASPILRKTITITDTPESADNGTSTPENRKSPEEATTPVLSIQNLLEQSALSESSLSQRSQRLSAVNLKRKTIGGVRPDSKKPRSKLKTRSLIANSIRSLGATTAADYMDLSQKSAQDLSRNEEVTTPTGAVQPIQEAVKNKHSTAKKTQSKRSIIDNLDESVLVKQLFNSPVKRKLFKSMTEFSRKKLFEDDEDVPRRPTRNTITLTGKTPDNSFMEHTEEFTADVFVSPMSTPGNSPNITGLKRLFANTPESDLQHVRGVKNILRTPRTRRSIKNDLNNVEGVKQVFARSPRNRLSDVRVKEIFAASPKNDLRRVTGVKTLFRSARKQKSPKNTLQDVRGVKNLFKNKKSIANDLRNVSGIKNALRVNSPRNNLSDVRGLRRLYRETDPKNDLSDVSGVKELFNETEDSQDSLFDVIVPMHETQNLNTTFDELIGKPTLRAYTKPRSFTKIVKPKQKRNAKSLSNSISMITENVEEWLQNEFEKCVHKEKSASKSNLTRELQKLTTDTVEGNTPVLLSRSRNSTLSKIVGNSQNQEQKKSASEIYSTHTLPIKKRSLVETTRRSHIDRLPIKKRRVVHSTPVKGRTSVTMNASELGRVSPIANVTAVGKIDGLLQQDIPKLNRKKTSIVDDKKLEIQTANVLSSDIAQKKTLPISPSPKKTRPKQTRISRISNRNNRRTSLVITKKKPRLSPKLNIETQNTVNVSIHFEDLPKRKRNLRMQSPVKTSKITRAQKIVANENDGQDIQNEALNKVGKTSKRKSINKELQKLPRKTRTSTKTTAAVTKSLAQSKPERNANSELIEKEVTKTEVKARERQQVAENVPDLTIKQKQSRRTRNAKNVIDVKPVAKPPTKSVKSPPVVKSKPNRHGKNVTFEVESKSIAITKRGVASKSINTEIVVEVPTDRRRQKDNVDAVVLPRTRKGQSKMTVIVENNASSNDEVGIKTAVKEKPKRGQKDVVENTEIEPSTTVRRITRKAQSEKITTEVKNNGPENNKEAPIARKTRNLQKNIPSEEIVNDTQQNKQKRGGRTTRNTKKSISHETPENNKEAVGKRSRNVLTSNTKGKGVEKAVLENKMEVDSSSRGRRNKNVADKEVPLENQKEKKRTPPVKEVRKRGGRNRKVELDVEPASKAALPEEVAKSSCRKRKVDAEETTVAEAPAKRLRVTRAAAAPAESAAVRRTRRR